MPRRKNYPNTIELKVPNEVSDAGFSTEDRYNAAQELLEKWPMEFQQFAEEGVYSRAHYQNVYHEYFGPEGSELTFGEIFNEYGSLEKWQQEQKKEKMVEASGMKLTDRELEIYERGLRTGYELANRNKKLEERN